MDFINPRAILLVPENFHEIITTVTVQNGTDTLNELYNEALNIKDRYYIVAWRILDSGLPTWGCYTEDQLIKHFTLESVEPYRNHFTKL